jgi:hypothetical protein
VDDELGGEAVGSVGAEEPRGRAFADGQPPLGEGLQATECGRPGEGVQAAGGTGATGASGAGRRPRGWGWNGTRRSSSQAACR